MYESHYGFTEKPFNLTPDPKYLFFSQRHSEAFAHLEFGRREKGGFILITGEVGTGKTTLARCFLSRLDAQTATAFVLYPALSGEELLRSILHDLHIPVAGTSIKDHVDALHRFLLDARAQDRGVVLLVDEAQDLSIEVLEQVRLISNLETDTEKLIQIVLMGQSELQEMLARRELRQIAQRVTARYHLAPLDRGDTEAYVRHRLAVAGGEGKVNFTSDAMTAVHQAAGGVPRLINLICDRALLAGYVVSTRVITMAMVRQAAGEALGGAPRRARLRRALPFALLAAGLVLAALAGAAVARLSAGPARLAPAVPAPAATLAVAPQPPPATQAPAAPSLAPVLLALDRDTSWRTAEAEVRGLWGPQPLERTVLRTHLEQVRRLSLPAILEMFHPARRDTCFVALVRLENGQALLARGAGATLAVPEAELDRLWTHQAVFLWRDHDALVAGGRRRTEAWARDTLGRLGYLGGDPDLARAVLRFQRDTELAADGLIGARTLMALYSLGGYPRPRLQGSTS